MGENAATVRALYEAFNSGDTAAAYALIDPGIEYVNPGDAVEPGTRHGLDSYDEAMGKVREVFGGAQIEVEEIAELKDTVVAVITFRYRAPGSDVEVEQRQGHVWTLRDGKAARFEWSTDPAGALEAISDRSSETP